MIKGISILRRAEDPTVFERLRSFFTAMGLAAGAGWQDSVSTGASFLAPLANLEFVNGQFPSVADVMIEVESLDQAYQAAERWLRANGGDEAMKRLQEPIDTDWKSRIFTVEPQLGFAFTFWAWTDPLKGKLVALEGDLSAKGMSFAIIVARWNAVITDRLLQGALDALLRSGAERRDIQVVRVPGAWEVPAAARMIAERKQVDAIVTLGCLIRGETAHYEAIYNEVARGIGQAQQETGIPHGFGILTCETLEQALNRAGIKAGNKGFEAAAAAIEMVSMKRKSAESGRS